MSTNKITIHRALSELKVMDSRIKKSIESIDPTTVMQGGKVLNSTLTKQKFESNAKSALQSAKDLMERKTKIKKAIVTANATTTVKIGNEEMTIADAINFKTTIAEKKHLIEVLRTKHRNINASLISENKNIEDVALSNAKIMLGKETDSSAKPTDDDVKQIMEPFIERRELSLIDPLEVEDLTKEMERWVDEFEIEVDSKLSEINAITFIEI